MISGTSYVALKIGGAVGFSFLPYSTWEKLAPWVPQINLRSQLAWESRTIAVFEASSPGDAFQPKRRSRSV